METRSVYDPFTGTTAQVSDRLVDRLRGKYASGPHLPNGNPEFGWRQFQAPPIQHEAAARIESLEAAANMALDALLLVRQWMDGMPCDKGDVRDAVEAAIQATDLNRNGQGGRSNERPA